MRTLTLAVSGMHCASCGLLIDDALLDLEGVRNARTDLRTGTCTVVADGRITDEALCAAVQDIGYPCSITTQASDAARA